MKRRKFLWLGLAGLGLLGATGPIYAAYRQDMSRARERIKGRSKLFDSRFGQMEYAEAGSGEACLVIHGTGGGFDQSLVFAEGLVASGWRAIAPSRFGYLQSAFPQNPSLENQADVLAELLDLLRIETVPVIGVSAGALTALQFALQHGPRCKALVAVVPATYVPGRTPQSAGPLAQAIISYGLKSDFLFWAGTKFAEDRMFETLLATPPHLVHQASEDEKKRVRSLLHDILPVSARVQGLINDGRQTALPPLQPIESIRVPTLAISLEDDLFGTAEAARYISQNVPQAKLIIYNEGGHVFAGKEDQMTEAINGFLRSAV
jgi:pimeloyl-ACP methyl ester carboxylesterase